MTRRILLLLCACAAAPAQSLPADTVAEVERIVTRIMAKESIPGVGVAIALRGEVVFANGYGMADLENFVPAKASTMFRLGSISKPITAVAAMQLAEEGKLDLDAPVQKYVPDFPVKQAPITVRQLLGHLGGIRHYRGREIDSTRHYEDLRAPLDIFRHDPLIADPGTKYSYTTYGYNLAGAAVEAAAGKRFLEYVEERVFRPAGATHLQDDNVYRIIPNRTRGYRKTADGRIVNCNLADTSNKIPGGGMISRAEDLVRFAVAVAQGKLLKPASVTAMFTPQTLAGGGQTRYGLGWNVIGLGGQQLVGHGGGQQGTATMLLLRPADAAAVAVMSNLEQSGAGAIARAIFEKAAPLQ